MKLNPILVVLSADDLKVIREIAERHDDKPPSAGGRNYGKADTAEAHFIGLCGEAAVSRHYQVPFRRYVSQVGDKHAGDTVLFGRSAEIKTATHWEPIIKFNYLKQFGAEIAILCHMVMRDEKAEIRICAWVWREEFLRHHEMMNFGHESARHCMLARNMNPMLTLESECKKPPREAHVRSGSQRAS